MLLAILPYFSRLVLKSYFAYENRILRVEVTLERVEITLEHVKITLCLIKSHSSQLCVHKLHSSVSQSYS
jgi:hypothetical protein